MSATVGSLLIDMALNTAAFASDLGKAKGSIDSWAASHNQVLAGVVNSWRGVKKEMAGVVEEVFSLRTAMLALIGGGALGELVKSNLESATALVHHADAIGITTDTLQQYGYVARLAGINQETLTGALEKFGKQVGQVQAGTGTLYTFLQKTNTGLLEQVRTAGTVDQAFDAVMRTMGNMDNQQARLALSAAAFSKGGLEMVNMVRDGAAAMEEQKQAAMDLGIVVGGDLLRNAQGAQEKLETLGMILKAKLMVAIISNSEEIGHFADALIKVIPVVLEFATGLMNTLTMFVNWKESLLDLAATLDGFAASVMIAKEKLKEYASFGLYDSTAATKKILDDLDDALLQIDDRVKKINAAQGKAAGGTGVEGRKYGGLDTSGMAEDIKAQSAAAKEADAAYKKLEQDAKHTFESTRTPLEKYNETLGKLNQELQAGLIDQETYNRGVDQAGTAYEKASGKGQLWSDLMSKAIHGQIKSWKDLGSAVLDYAENLLTALATGQKSGGIGAGDIANIFSGSSGIGSALSSAGTWISSFFHSGGIVGSSGGGSRRVDSSVFSNAPRMHGGGLVGGEVPIIAQKGERVLTEAQQKAMGNGGTTYNIDARGADMSVETRLRGMIEALNNSIEQRAVAATVGARNRNPNLFSLQQ